MGTATPVGQQRPQERHEEVAASRQHARHRLPGGEPAAPQPASHRYRVRGQTGVADLPQRGLLRGEVQQADAGTGGMSLDMPGQRLQQCSRPGGNADDCGRDRDRRGPGHSCPPGENRRAHAAAGGGLAQRD